MPTCKKCQTKFKTWQIIDGVGKNLGHRKYCLTCSPYNQHNTQKIHSVTGNSVCLVCETTLKNSQVKYCSTKCKAYWHYANFKSQPNSTHSQYIRGYIRKLALIKLNGNCCKTCGYNKNLAVLQFHHVGSKSFGLDVHNIANSSWSTVLEESKKCILLCSRCHQEHHHPELELELLMKEYGDDVDKFIIASNTGNKKPRILRK
jgi:hypothetical protein